MRQTNVRLPAEVREALEERASAEGRTLTWLIELGARLVIADPSINGPEDIEQLRAELAAAKAEAGEESPTWPSLMPASLT